LFICFIYTTMINVCVLTYFILEALAKYNIKKYICIYTVLIKIQNLTG